MRPFPFTRTLVVNDLQRHADALTSRAPDSEITVTSELSIDGVLEQALRSNCDLILMRPPGTWALARLLCESPCSVCLLPPGAALSLERPLVRLSLTPRGSRLLSLGAALTRHAGAEELLVVHNTFAYDIDEQPGLAERFRTRDELAIYRFLARADLCGVNVSPIREARPGEARALLEVARRRGADLLIVDPGADGNPVWQWNRREAQALAMRSEIAVLLTDLSNQDRTWKRVLCEQLFTDREPKFN